MRKILLIYLILSTFLIVGCIQESTYKWPNSKEPQERFCNSKGFSYESGDYNNNIMFCTRYDGVKIPFEYMEFINYTPSNCCECNCCTK